MTETIRSAPDDAARFARALGAALFVTLAGFGAAFAQSADDEATVTEPDEPVRPDVYYRADGSLLVTGTVGFITLNQEAGDGVDQGNVIALAFTTRDAAIAQAAASSVSGLPSGADFEAIRTLRFADASIGAQGVVMVNQSVGVGTGQLNVLSVASTESGPALAFASAVQNNETRYFGDAYGGRATLSGVGGGMTGLFAINQDLGVDGSQANIVAVANSADGPASAVVIAGAETLRRFPDPVEPPIDPEAPVEPGEGGETPPPADPVDPPVEPDIDPVIDDGAVDPEAPVEEEEEPEPNPQVRLTFDNNFVGASGVAQVNQSGGAGNAQANLLAAAFGTDTSSATVLADADLAVVGAAPALDERQPLDARFDGSGSFEGFSGVGQVNRVAGYDNQVVNAIAITVVRIGGAP